MSLVVYLIDQLETAKSHFGAMEGQMDQVIQMEINRLNQAIDSLTGALN